MENLDQKPHMEITLEVKKAYGRTLVYPRCQTSELLAKLAGHKTLTDDDLRYIVSLGYSVKWFTPSVEISLPEKSSE